MDFNGLKDTIVQMLGGARCKINTRTFQNDMANIESKDDVLTLLVHLGYLAYDSSRKEVYIPNQEIADEFKNAVEYSGWEGVSKALTLSEEILNATLRGDGEAVAAAIDDVHMENTSVLAYHNELSLSYVVSIAYYVARKDYLLIRELPSGKGFADIAFLPLKHSDKPPFIVELKWDNSAEGAISQIKEKKYTGVLSRYSSSILLVGINYDKASKTHHCLIEIYDNM